ncbi:hypothetical protein MWE_0759 [Helicobacter pylori XZ274]|nr:hypothetical protein MWE_0759 [Helicobacter pylori XZ274]
MREFKRYHTKTRLKLSLNCLRKSLFNANKMLKCHDLKRI